MNWSLKFEITGHLLKTACPYSSVENGTDYSMRNLKRVVEVWWDDYKFMFYKDHPERLKIDAGDLTEALLVKKKLNCKSFHYYLETVAPRILERYPIKSRPDFASGAIQSIANKTLCISNAKVYTELNLDICSENLLSPGVGQHFNLTWLRMILVNGPSENCFNDNIIWPCHYQQGNQMFRFISVNWNYNLSLQLKQFLFKQETSQIMNPRSEHCLSANFSSSTVDFVPCERSDINQKWNFGYKNIGALNNWHGFGVKIRN